MKKILYMLVMIFMLTIGINEIKAKEVEKICKYDGQIKDGTVEIECQFYEDNSHSCEFTKINEKSNSEKFVNWGAGIGDNYFNAKKYYSEKKECFPYVVFINKRSLFNGYELYAADSYTTASSYVSNSSSEYDISIVQNSGKSEDSTELINSYIEMLNNIGKYFDLDSHCGNKDGKYYVDFNKLYESCREDMQEVYSKINEWNKFVQLQIESGKLEKDDEIVKKYYAARDAARAQFDSSFDESQLNPVDDNKQLIDPTNGKTLALIQKIYRILKILIPVLIVLLSIVDFLKVVLLSDEKDYKNAWNKFVKRIIIGIVFFIVPVLVSFLLKYSGIEIEQSFLQIFVR